MKKISLLDLQESVQDSSAFGALKDYYAICNAFLQVIQNDKPTRIVSPSQANYIFYQYAPSYGHKITRPLNSNLFFEGGKEFKDAFERFVALNKLDGVYYVDPRPEMLVNERLREQIHDFQKFLIQDLWKLSA